jgi:predicted N-formylglutamate amidohydrolase
VPTLTTVEIANRQGGGPFVIACDHASNRIPDEYGTLGLSPLERISHVAWDPGALAVSRALSDLLDAPLVASRVSRLVVDCNRDLDAPDLIWTVSETTRIPGNEGISAAERATRIAKVHAPFHTALDAVLDQRQAAGLPTALVCVHSFTPIYHGRARPWPIGLIHGRDVAFTERLRDRLLDEDGDLMLGWNEPYSAMSGVTYTLEHHGDGRGLPATMIEIRHDGILTPAGVELWAHRLARALLNARPGSARPRPRPPTLHRPTLERDQNGQLQPRPVAHRR